MTATVEAPVKRRPRGHVTHEPWWGQGSVAPHLEWPGVTIEIPSVWRNDRWESPDGRYFFDRKAADDACDFFPELLTHHIGEFAGQPFVLRADQARLLTRPIFGWKRSTDGLRRFRKVFAFCPKGWGKSPWAAGTGIFMTRCDHEPAAEVYALAADRENARTVHDNAKIMVEGSPLLMDGCEITKNAIVWSAIHSSYKVLSADASRAHGFRPSAAIFDEMHAQKNRDLYEAIKKSMVKRRQPLMIIITHAGSDDEGICYEEYDYARGVLTGRIQDEACLPVIFEAQVNEDWASPKTWVRVNPGHGTTVKHDGIAAECLEAQNDPQKLNDFLRYHLNRWVNQATAWLPLDWWDACQDPIAPDSELTLLPVTAGLDLAQKIDLACLCLTFRHQLESAVAVDVVAGDEAATVARTTIQLNYRVTLLPFFWIPENTMRQREKEDGVPYAEWVRQGLVTPTEGDIIDYDRIYQDITTKIVPRFPRLKQGGIGYDPAFATDIASSLRDKAGFRVEEILQGYKYLSEPSYVFEALIKAKRIAHGGNRVLRNHIENVSVKKDDSGRIRPVKPKRASKHIDGVVSSLMGLRMLAASQEPEPQYQAFIVGGHR